MTGNIAEKMSHVHTMQLINFWHLLKLIDVTLIRLLETAVFIDTGPFVIGLGSQVPSASHELQSSEHPKSPVDSSPAEAGRL